MADLPTTPIGKQQVIDLKAGTILRQNQRRNNLYLGCPIGILLFIIVVVKCSVLSVWIIREYDAFDFRCTAWDAESTPSIFRSKRWTMFSDSNTDPRSFSKSELKNTKKNEVIVNESINRKPLYAASRKSMDSPTSEPPKIDPRLDFGPLPPTFKRKNPGISDNYIGETDNNTDEDIDDLPLSTMVTLTNTQIIPLKGEQHGVVKMKTIRNRVEKVGSDEEQFIEIDIANAPRIYVSKIKSRHGGEQEEESTDFDLLKDLPKEKKKKKKKGKGLKKAKKLENEKKKKEMEEAMNSTTNEQVNVTSTTNKKEGGKKNKKNNKSRHQNEINEEAPTEMTKTPRHLVSGSGSTRGPGAVGVITTPRPHKSSWINGIVDPDDPKFSNQGQIRGYPMHRASKKPSPPTIVEVTTKSVPASQENLKISDSTRMMWDMDEMKYTTFMAPPKTTQITKSNDEEEDESTPPTYDEPQTTSEAEKEEDEYGWKLEKQYESGTREDKDPNTPKKIILDATGKGDTGSVASYDIYSAIPSSSRNQLPHSNTSPYYVEVNDADTETIYVKDVTPIYRNFLEERAETTTKQYDPEHFENELQKLKESSICLARMAFDVWSLFILFSAVPFIMGICVPRWSLFVLHIVFDFLFLVVAFVTSLTIAIMSIIMYFLVDDMTQESLFEFLLVSFIIDIIVVLYTVIIIISYRCCCRLVENFIKDNGEPYCVTNGEQV